MDKENIMSPEQALQLLWNVALEASIPLKNFPNLQSAVQILENFIKPKAEEKPE